MVPMPVLIAILAAAGIWYTGAAAVHAIRKAEHAILHPFRRHAAKKKPKKPAATVREKCWENSGQSNCQQKLTYIEH